MSNDQLAELTKHIDKGFKSVDDSFEKMFIYMNQQFSLVDKRFNEITTKFDRLQSTVDAYAKQVLDLTQEHLMLGRKVDRMERWIQQLAQKAGVKLNH